MNLSKNIMMTLLFMSISCSNELERTCNKLVINSCLNNIINTISFPDNDKHLKLHKYKNGSFFTYFDNDTIFFYDKYTSLHPLPLYIQDEKDSLKLLIYTDDVFNNFFHIESYFDNGYFFVCMNCWGEGMKEPKDIIKKEYYFFLFDKFGNLISYSELN